jgi:hypothetical protein
MANTTGAEAPPTVLRSRYMHVRALLAIAITAIDGLTVALVIVATSTNSQSAANSVASVNPLPIRFDHSALSADADSGVRGKARSQRATPAATRSPRLSGVGSQARLQWTTPSPRAVTHTSPLVYMRHSQAGRGAGRGCRFGTPPVTPTGMATATGSPRPCSTPAVPTRRSSSTVSHKLLRRRVVREAPPGPARSEWFAAAARVRKGQ